MGGQGGSLPSILAHQRAALAAVASALILDLMLHLPWAVLSGHRAPARLIGGEQVMRVAHGVDLKMRARVHTRLAASVKAAGSYHPRAQAE